MGPNISPIFGICLWIRSNIGRLHCRFSKFPQQILHLLNFARILQRHISPLARIQVYVEQAAFCDVTRLFFLGSKGPAEYCCISPQFLNLLRRWESSSNLQKCTMNQAAFNFIDVVLFHISSTWAIPILPVCYLGWKKKGKKIFPSLYLEWS